MADGPGWPSPANARHRAMALEERLHAFVAFEDPLPEAGEGPLAGLPYASKDMFYIAGRAPTCGLREAVAPVPSETAEVLRLLDGAGAVRIGVTVMSGLAYEPSGRNPLIGTPVNPWNPDFVPGGSSSGSAVAVASGSVPVALGSDTAGSLRMPAQCCGVFSWKPAHGRVPMGGAMPLSPSLDTVGALASRAADLGAVAAVMAGVEAGGETPEVVVLGDTVEQAETRVCWAVEDALAALGKLGVASRRASGCALLKRAADAALKVLDFEAARCHGHLMDDPRIGPELTKRLGKASAITEAERGAALDQLGAAKAEAISVWGESPVVALPVMPIRTPPVAEIDPASRLYRPRTLYEMSAYTFFVNAFGWAAVAVPVGLDDRGMPVAMQLVGPPETESRLLALARRLEESGRLPRLTPPLPEIP